MFQFFVPKGHVRDGHAYIDGGDVNHICNVLRMRVGEQLRVVMDGDSNAYLCKVASMSEDEVVCDVVEVYENSTELPARIYLFQGLPKSDKMELIIQKAVELGVYQVVPVATKNAVVKLDDKKAAGKVTRWNAIAEAAAKQSKRSIIPEVHSVVTMKEAVKMVSEMDLGLIAYELADMDGMDRTRGLLSGVKPGESVGILIGPEGGFTEAEVEACREAGVEAITLGRRILRTETAGMTVLAWLLYILEK